MDEYSADISYQGFVKICRGEGSDEMEVPGEKNGTMLLSTVKGQFPSAVGLKYKSSSGGWRGVRAEDNVLDPPPGGWGETVYYITQAESGSKRKASSDASDTAVKSSKTRVSKTLQDMAVLGLPYTTTDEELKEYFEETCGELAFYEVKVDRQTNKSKGFGFIRFKTEEAANEALNGEHVLKGRKLEIRGSKKKDNIQMKLFIGRLPNGTDQTSLRAQFEEFGEMTDVYVPTNPFRGFGFITFASKDDGNRVLREVHVMEGSRLNIKETESKHERSRREQQQSSNSKPSDYSWNAGGNSGYSSQDQSRNNQGGNDMNNQGGNNMNNQGGNDMLKNMLLAFRNNQGGNDTNNQGGNDMNNQGGNDIYNQRGNDINNQRGNDMNNQGGNDMNNQGGNDTNNQGGNDINNQRGNDMNNQRGNDMNNQGGNNINNKGGNDMLKNMLLALLTN